MLSDERVDEGQRVPLDWFAARVVALDSCKCGQPVTMGTGYCADHIDEARLARIREMDAEGYYDVGDEEAA